MALLNKDAYNPVILRILNQGLHTELFDPFGEYQPEVDIYQLVRRSGLNVQKLGQNDSNQWFDGATKTITIPENRSFEEDYLKTVRLIVAVAYLNYLPKDHQIDDHTLNQIIDMMTIEIVTPHGVLLSQFLQQTKSLNLPPNPSLAAQPQYQVIVQYLAHIFHVTARQVVIVLQNDPYEFLDALGVE